MDLRELEEKGWTYVDNINSKEDLIETGRRIGEIALTPNNETLKEITKFSKVDAPKGSQSSLYGTGAFPLHTDTVFWEIPAKYVILRAHGDVRRKTTLQNVSNLLAQCKEKYRQYLVNSLWYAGHHSKRFICSMRFRYNGSIVWRIDADLLKPANKAATESLPIIRELVFTDDTEQIQWTGNNAVVIQNWTVLHGRGKGPENERKRTIQRLYVR